MEVGFQKINKKGIFSLFSINLRIVKKVEKNEKKSGILFSKNAFWTFLKCPKSIFRK